MKFLTFITILSVVGTIHAQVVNGPNGSYIVQPAGNGNTLVTGDNSSTYIQHTWNGVNIISSGSQVDQGALNAAALIVPPPSAPSPIVPSNP